MPPQAHLGGNLFVVVAIEGQEDDSRSLRYSLRARGTPSGRGFGNAIGFVYNLHCESCGYVKHHVTIGLAAGCGSTLTIIQDQTTGVIRQIAVTQTDIERVTGKTEFSSEDEWFAAMDAVIESQMAESEKQIAPQEAFCPNCRMLLRNESAGIS